MSIPEENIHIPTSSNEAEEPALQKKPKISQDNVRKVDPEAILQLIKGIAANGDRFKMDIESESKLEQVLEYKSNAQSLVVNEEILPGQRETHELTPAIFTKKTAATAPKQGKNMMSWTIAFENYLNMVAQLYYKKNFNIRELFIIPGENKETQLQNTTACPGEKKKRGRKHGSKSIAAKENASSDEVLGKRSQGGTGRRGRPCLNTSLNNGNGKEEKQNDNGGGFSFPKEEIQLSILDQLVNPLKTDFVFELWSPKEIAIFECAMCRFGRQFGFISSLIGSKTHKDVFEFYQMWKTTSHYKTWKLHRSISNRNNHSHLI